jgi:BirA family transcriptional regulator, biotin operon repressor / biotin---[acetyl-CoA-carboxylase] ligase
MTEGPGPASAASSPGRWGIQSLWEELNPLLPGLSIEVLDRVASTNTELVERLRQASHEGRGRGRGARADDLRPSLLVAVQQTQGRGRLGRAWLSSPEASLTFSLSLAISRTDWSGLSLAVGVAVADALDPTGRHISLKWPNDLWMTSGEPRKLGGVLVEAMTLGDHRVAVIGVGLNVQPVHLAERVAAISEFEADATAPAVLARVMPSLARGLLAFERAGFASASAAFAARDMLRGRPITTTDPTCPRGMAQGVDADGALLMQAEGQTHRIVSGEVSVRPASGGPAAADDPARAA